MEPTTGWRDILLRLRESNGWRQEDLANELGVSKQSVQLWEAGKTTPRSSRLAAIERLAAQHAAKNTVRQDLFANYQITPEIRKIARIVSSESEVPPPLEKLRQQLAEELPEELRKNVGGSLRLKAYSYKYTYLSNKVVATALWANTSGISQTVARAYGWRMMLAMRAYDDDHLQGHHYLFALVATPGANAAPPSASQRIQVEVEANAITFMTFSSPGQLASYIIHLESTPTEADEFYENQRQLFNESDELEDLF